MPDTTSIEVPLAPATLSVGDSRLIDQRVADSTRPKPFAPAGFKGHWTKAETDAHNARIAKKQRLAEFQLKIVAKHPKAAERLSLFVPGELYAGPMHGPEDDDFGEGVEGDDDED